jgi:hypothetical protein
MNAAKKFAENLGSKIPKGTFVNMISGIRGWRNEVAGGLPCITVFCLLSTTRVPCRTEL